MVPQLPINIIERILEHLSGDPSTLKHCTLVCRRWLSPSSLELFRKLELHPMHHCRIALPLDCPLESILLSLQGSTRLRESVQELAILAYRSPPCRLSALQHCLAGLSRLQSLRLSSVHLTTTGSASATADVPAPDTLLALQLVQLENIPGITTCEGEIEVDASGCNTALAAFLNLFHSIDDLVLDNVGRLQRLPAGATPTPLPREGPLQLRALRLYTSPSVDMFPVVRSMVDPTRVTELSVAMNAHTLTLIGGILGALPHLEMLLLSSLRALVGSRPTGFEEPVAIPELENCSRLKALLISSDWSLQERPDHPTMPTHAVLWHNMTHILSFAPPQTRSVAIQLRFRPQLSRDAVLRHFEQRRWTAFEALAARQEHLEEVSFENNAPWPEGVEDVARASVSDGLRRVLRFGIHDSWY